MARIEHAAMDGVTYMETFTKTQERNVTHFRSYDIGCGSAVAHASIDSRWACRSNTGWTLVVRNPRREYLTNLYHVMEEVYSLFQTSMLARVPLDAFDLRFVGAGEILPFAMQLLDTVVHNVTSTPFFASCRCCTIVTPLRACKGSFLPLSWSQSYAGRDRLTLSVVTHITRGLPIPEEDERVLLMTRSSARVRRLNIPWLPGCLDRTPHGMRRFENLHRLTMVEQIRLVRNHRTLVGPHGAGLTHVLFLRPGGHLVEISRHDPRAFRMIRSVANIYKNMAEWSGHRYTHLNRDILSCATVMRALDHTTV